MRDEDEQLELEGASGEWSDSRRRWIEREGSREAAAPYSVLAPQRQKAERRERVLNCDGRHKGREYMHGVLLWEPPCGPW